MPERNTWRRWLIGLVATLIVLVAAAGTAVAVELRQYRSEWQERALPGAVVNGVDVSGMTADEIARTMEAELAPRLDREVTVRVGDRSWTVTPREMGATSNAREIAAEAVATSTDVSWIDLAKMRWRDHKIAFSRDVGITYPTKPVRDLVREMGKTVHRDPVEAQLTWTRSRPVVKPGKPGQALDGDPAFQAIMPALQGKTGRTVKLTMRPLKPETTVDEFRRILFLRQDAHRLELWRDGQRVRTYTVATGTGDYPTPTGLYHISQKRPAPTWINPDPDGWGKDMPERIEPGPNNPLGLRALNWSAAGAIRFHGTANVSSLGRDASHGCVRLANEDVVELFDLVEVGDRIISLS